MATALGLLAIVGIAGVTVDLGRMYIAKNELMAYTDAASIAAAVQLDGTTTGITRAKNAGAAMGTGAHAMGWDFATKLITGATYQFAKGIAATPQRSRSGHLGLQSAKPDRLPFCESHGLR
jgi:uncharacterized membrane protein